MTIPRVPPRPLVYWTATPCSLTSGAEVAELRASARLLEQGCIQRGVVRRHLVPRRFHHGGKVVRAQLHGYAAPRPEGMRTKHTWRRQRNTHPRRDNINSKRTQWRSPVGFYSQASSHKSAARLITMSFFCWGGKSVRDMLRKLCREGGRARQTTTDGRQITMGASQMSVSHAHTSWASLVTQIPTKHIPRTIRNENEGKKSL